MSETQWIVDNEAGTRPETPGKELEAGLEPDSIGSSLAEYARSLESNRSEEEDGLPDAAVYTNRAAQKGAVIFNLANPSLSQYGLAAVSAGANLGSQAAEQYLRMDEDEEPPLDLEHEVGRLAREDAERLMQESEITAAERPSSLRHRRGTHAVRILPGGQTQGYHGLNSLHVSRWMAASRTL